MGGLSMNPDHDGEARPKLATQIAEKEDWKETTDGTSQKDPENLEPKPVKKMKIGFFEFDSTYLTSLQGIMRVAQVVR